MDSDWRFRTFRKLLTEFNELAVLHPGSVSGVTFSACINISIRAGRSPRLHWELLQLFSLLSRSLLSLISEEPQLGII